MLLLPAGLVSLSLLSCTDDFAPCPDYRVGAVEGVVTWLGEPAAGITLQATCLGDCDQRRSVITDSTGRYRLELPEGRYHIRPINLPTVQSVSTEIYAGLRVGPLTSRRDLAYGRVTGRLTAPDGFAGGSVTLNLEGDHGVRLRDDFPFEDGAVTFDFPMVEPGSYRLWLPELSTYDSQFSLPVSAGSDSVDFAVADDAPTVRDFDLSGSL
ncbi:carboxypeptidase regulatory-like domain-containing protein, partial [bacterium]|nr:carboxypeptidase regulatory-like domain-containing protein [bacterium]